MAHVQEYIQTFEPSECEYDASHGGWILPSERHPTAKLVKATQFHIKGRFDFGLSKLKSVTVGFEISISDGHPSMKDANVAIMFQNNGKYEFHNVQQQVHDMKTNTRTWVTSTFKATDPVKDGLFSFTHSIPPATIGGLTFYQAKIIEYGED